MDKLDLKKQYRHLYSPSAKNPEIIVVPPLIYIMVDGHGDPNTAPEYGEAIQTLYSLSYTLKFHMKKSLGMDYGVMGLEGLWWMPDMTRFKSAPKSEWDWTMMILQPDFITQAFFDEARQLVRAKGKAASVDNARLETYLEGPAVQIMYLGPYADEGPTIASLHQFAIDQGYSLQGKHHEIYLSDPRRVAPEKMKTIIRQPVLKK
ncbi:MAG TPA: GyrI-like domain-containing protein [Anaerolineaceae bacterium]|nr:GyrI-like domain-containing protein [Anaerolineaceae bacterium]